MLSCISFRSVKVNKKVGISAASILIIVLAIGRMFISDQKEKIEAENNKLMAGIRKAYLIKKQRSDFSIDSLLKLQGKIYLYTNDREAQLAWAPNLENYSYTSTKAMISDAIMAEKFVNKKDSLGFLLLLKTGSNAIYPVNKGIMLNQANKKIWFVGLDYKNKTPDTAKTSLSKQPFFTNWGIGFNDVEQVNTKMLSNGYTLGSAFLAKNSKSFFFYMVGYDQDNHQIGIDSLGFVKATKVFSNLLEREGVKTNNFVIKAFNHR